MKKKENLNLMIEQLLFNSNIFKPSEINIMTKRLDGSYKDKCGIFTNKIKPKILEIMMWNESNLKKVLKQIIKQKNNSKKSEVELFLDQRKKIKSMSYEEFNKKL